MCCSVGAFARTTAATASSSGELFASTLRIASRASRSRTTSATTTATRCGRTLRWMMRSSCCQRRGQSCRSRMRNNRPARRFTAQSAASGRRSGGAARTCTSSHRQPQRGEVYPGYLPTNDRIQRSYSTLDATRCCEGGDGDNDTVGAGRRAPGWSASCEGRGRGARAPRCCGVAPTHPRPRRHPLPPQSKTKKKFGKIS